MGQVMTTDLDEKLEQNMKPVQETKPIYLGRGWGFRELLEGILGKFTVKGKCVKPPDKTYTPLAYSRKFTEEMLW